AQYRSARRPVSQYRGVTRLQRGLDDLRVVVDERSYLPSRKPAQHTQLIQPCWTSVGVAAQKQLTGRQPVPVEPLRRGRAQPFGPAGEPCHLVPPGEVGCQRHTFVQWGVVVRGREKAAPVLRAALQMVQAMPDIGDDTVDVKHDEAHASSVVGRDISGWRFTASRPAGGSSVRLATDEGRLHW